MGQIKNIKLHIVTDIKSREKTLRNMAPQKFADLGKEARDLLSKNFHFGTVKIEAKTKAANGLAFTAEGSHNTGNGDVGGSLEGKMTLKPHGVTITRNGTLQTLCPEPLELRTNSSMVLKSTSTDHLHLSLVNRCRMTQQHEHRRRTTHVWLTRVVVCLFMQPLQMHPSTHTQFIMRSTTTFRSRLLSLVKQVQIPVSLSVESTHWTVPRT